MGKPTWLGDRTNVTASGMDSMTYSLKVRGRYRQGSRRQQQRRFTKKVWRGAESVF